MNAAFGVLINNDELFYKNFLKEGTKVIGVFDPASATTGLNYLLKEIESQSKYDTAILLHQDVRLPENWLEGVEAQLGMLPGNWMVAGIWGAKLIGEHKTFFGNVIDSRIGRRMGGDHPVGIYAGPLPMEVETLDEVCLIVNLKYGFRFDERYRGFDLYGTYISLWAKKNGLSAWAIDAPLTHDTRRTWAWKPDMVFLQNWDMLDTEFPNPDYNVISTVY